MLIAPPTKLGDDLDAFIDLLLDSVDAGASIGFLPPLTREVAADFWREMFEEVATGRRILLVARDADRIAGSVQLALAMKPNSLHRAEVQKLLVHRIARRRGVGRALMVAAEAAARDCGRTLLILDTRRGDDAERLYANMGWSRAGVIPRYVTNAEGTMDDTVVFYKELSPAG